MPYNNYANLDFDQIKTQIKDYLRSNSNFSGFDFDGSNFSVLIKPCVSGVDGQWSETKSDIANKSSIELQDIAENLSMMFLLLKYGSK